MTIPAIFALDPFFNKQSLQKFYNYIDTLDLATSEKEKIIAHGFAVADLVVVLDNKWQIKSAYGLTQSLLGFSEEELKGKPFISLLRSDSQAECSLKLSCQKQHQNFNNNSGRIGGKVIEGFGAYLRDIGGGFLPFIIGGYYADNDSNKNQENIYLSLVQVRANSRYNHDYKIKDSLNGLYNQSSFVEALCHKIASHNIGNWNINIVNFIAGNNNQKNQIIRSQEQIANYLLEISVDRAYAAQLNDYCYAVLTYDNIPPDDIIAQIRSRIANINNQEHNDNDNDNDNYTLSLSNISYPHYIEKTGSHSELKSFLNFTINHSQYKLQEDFPLGQEQSGQHPANIVNNYMISDIYSDWQYWQNHRKNAYHSILNSGEFNIALQPIVDLKDEAAHHYEALLRLNPNEYFKNTFEFITFGEDIKAASKFDMVMLEKNLQKLREMSRNNQICPSISLNISGLSINNDEWIDNALALLDEYQDVSHNVIFELTETIKLENLADTNRRIQKFRNRGYKFCIDDFGDGEASFDYILNINVDYVKIDGGYIKDALNNERHGYLLRAVAMICRNQNITMVGEMIEDQPTAAFLWDNGVRFGQGYHFGKPSLDYYN